MSTGRRLSSSARSATRAEWFAERVDANVATASTRVPPAVASEAIVATSAIVAAGSAGSKRVQLVRVLAQDLALTLVVEGLQLGRVVEWTRHALDVRPVGAEDHAVGAHVLDHLAHVILPERVDPDVATEGLGRILGEVARHLVRGRRQLLEEVAQEVG